ncbi:MAG: hypothetical protein WC750_04590 [Patescibacteria group bacterium]|jgi:hypothetical protein
MDTKTPLEQWRDRYAHDRSAEYFEPTAEKPVFELVTATLEPDRSVTVYGVKYQHTGITGLSFVPIYGFDWFLDQDEAKREALFRMWLRTAKVRELSRDLPGSITRQLITTADEIQIGEVAGKPLVVYRVWCTGLSDWKFVWRMAKLRETWAANLWDKFGVTLSRNLVKVPSLEDDSPIPEIYSLHYANYPDTGEPMYRYGVVCLYRFQPMIDWCVDREHAQERLNEATEFIRRVRKERHDQEEHKTAERLSVQAWSAANDLSCKNRRFNSLRGCIEPTLVAGFEETYQDNSGRELRELPLEVLLDGAARLEAVTAELGQALEAEYQKRLAFIAEHDALSTLNKLLTRHLGICPICAQPFEHGPEWMTELLVYGEAYLHCDHGCPENGYERHERTTCPSRIIREAFDGETERSEALPKVAFMGDQGYEHPAVELRRINSGDETLIQLVLDTHNVRLRPALKVDLEKLAKATNGTSRRCANDSDTPTMMVDTWTDVAIRLGDERQARAEESVRKGESVKLQFRWDGRHGRWGAKARTNGHTTVWTVDEAFASEMNEFGTFYCRILRTPERAATPTFTLHIVRPYLLAKRTNSNRSDRRAE